MWCSPYKRCTISDSVARARVEMSRVPRLRIAILAILARIAFDHACGEQRTVEEKRGVFIEGEREQRWERNLSASMSQRHNVIDRGSGRFRSDAFFFTTAIVATVLYRMLFGQIGATVVSLAWTLSRRTIWAREFELEKWERESFVPFSPLKLEIFAQEETVVKETMLSFVSSLRFFISFWLVSCWEKTFCSLTRLELSASRFLLEFLLGKTEIIRASPPWIILDEIFTRLKILTFHSRAEAN